MKKDGIEEFSPENFERPKLAASEAPKSHREVWLQSTVKGSTNDICWLRREVVSARWRSPGWSCLSAICTNLSLKTTLVCSKRRGKGTTRVIGSKYFSCFGILICSGLLVALDIKEEFLKMILNGF